MEIPVLVEPMAGHGFRASAGPPLPLSADGATPEEAVCQLRLALNQQLTGGKRLVSVEWPAADNPWLAMAGIHDPHDPLVAAWKERMAEYRHEAQQDPERS